MDSEAEAHDGKKGIIDFDRASECDFYSRSGHCKGAGGGRRRPGKMSGAGNATQVINYQ